jgi:hypothetical protein
VSSWYPAGTEEAEIVVLFLREEGILSTCVSSGTSRGTGNKDRVGLVVELPALR